MEAALRPLPPSDAYARRLAKWFAELDKKALQRPGGRPGKPPAPDRQVVATVQLREQRELAYTSALQRWDADYLKPWQRRLSLIHI